MFCECEYRGGVECVKVWMYEQCPELVDLARAGNECLFLTAKIMNKHF